MFHAAITGWGMAVPDRVLTNADLERMVDVTLALVDVARETDAA